MKLEKGDYISLAGLSIEQFQTASKRFEGEGFNADNLVIWNESKFLGVDDEGDIVALENFELYGTELRFLSYDQIVGTEHQDGFMNLNTDPVNHPPHYTQHPSGVECIQITEHMSFNLGNAIKYVWRADLKNDAVEDLKKAVFYINREIDKVTK